MDAILSLQEVVARGRFLFWGPRVTSFDDIWNEQAEQEDDELLLADEEGGDGEILEAYPKPPATDHGMLFALEEVEPWRAEWQDMPEFTQIDLQPCESILVHFATLGDMERFAKLVGQTITPRQRRIRNIWYPQAEIGHFANKRYVCRGDYRPPRAPIYIISKGRADSRLTAKALEKIGVPYRIVIEPQEYDQYAAVIAPEKILTLPFSNLGQGSIPARNWVWDHAIEEGHDWHWILDDNINGFFRLNRNLKTPVGDGTIFRLAEDFAGRYENVVQAGFEYFMMLKRKFPWKPYRTNTRIYSCILLRNDLAYRWRGRYNEDTDLSLRLLKGGWSTVLFHAFLAFKTPTMTMQGGNTDELYRQDEEFDGRQEMAESLRQQHPDVTKVVWKWGRWQHHVDYSGFRQQLRRKPGVVVPEGVNDYGMVLEEKIDGRWVEVAPRTDDE